MGPKIEDALKQSIPNPKSEILNSSPAEYKKPFQFHSLLINGEFGFV
jgi:hypothetical protein